MDQLNNLTFWDVKDAFNKVKNVVMNYTEMEAKVHEATNNEPWGASTTLMTEIAQGTHHYQHFNEIMTTIYKRFTEKEAKYWRQIYKALQLLEYLVKNGSDRVVDDARSHMTLLKIMKNFSYIDEKGKDQGINVRNRARELVELLNDTEKIKMERKKARANRTKYTGVSSESAGFGNANQYRGFGSESISGSRGFRDQDDDMSYYRYNDSSTQMYSERSERSPSSFQHRKSSSDSRNDLSYTRTTTATNNNSLNNRNVKEDKIANRLVSSSSSSSSSASKVKETNLVDLDDIFSDSNNTSNVNNNINDFSELHSITLDDDFQDFQSAPLSLASANTTTTAATGAGTRSSTSSTSLGLSSLSLINQNITSTTTTTTINNNNNNNINLLDDLIDSVPSNSSITPNINVHNNNINNNNNNNNNNNIIPSSSSLVKPTLTTTLQNQQPTLTNPQKNDSNDIWAMASNLVSLDSLGKEKNDKPIEKPSMNSLTQSGSLAWSVKGTWPNNVNNSTTSNDNISIGNNNATLVSNQQVSQKPQDPFDLLF